MLFSLRSPFAPFLLLSDPSEPTGRPIFSYLMRLTGPFRHSKHLSYTQFRNVIVEFTRLSCTMKNWWPNTPHAPRSTCKLFFSQCLFCPLRKSGYHQLIKSYPQKR